MDPELRDLLRMVAVDQMGDSYTHVTTYGPHARWQVHQQSHEEFWVGYCDLVYRKKHGRDSQLPDPNATLCLAEKPQDVMPVISKLTLKFQVDPDDSEIWEPYNDDFLQWLCHTYQRVISDKFQISGHGEMELVVVVLESENHWFEEENGVRYMVMEIRLQFPYARIDVGLQNRIIRSNVIKSLRKNNIIAKLPRQAVGDWEQIISTTVINEPVMMYGSSEIVGRPKLEITHIWPHITDTILEDNIESDDYVMADVFEIVNHNHVYQGLVNQEIIDNGYDLDYWIPMFLSVGYWNVTLLEKTGVNNGRFTEQLRTMNNTRPIFGMNRRPQTEVDDSDMELAERMIPMLDAKRFTNENFWYDIGKALYMAHEGADGGILAWATHTKRILANNNIEPLPFMRANGTVDETCESLYHTFMNSPISVKTLAWYAREDSKEQYAQWHQDWCISSMELAIKGGYHTDVAVALHRVYWLEFVYCPIGKGKWFHFRNHRWQEDLQGLNLRRAMSKDFMKRFERLRAQISAEIAANNNDEAFSDQNEVTLKQLAALIAKLKSVPFKSSLLVESCEHFKHDRFISLLDTNSELTGVPNGVLEISGQHVMFRTAKPEDYISMCAGTRFREDLTWHHPLVLDTLKWIRQVFTDEPLQHHFLKFAASCLRGRNSDKIFPIWTGDGDNSKSMIVKLFETTFNVYCIKFPVCLLTEKAANSGGPTPQLARAKATRLAFLDEPEDDTPMHKGTIKRYTGGDSFFARMLQDNGGDVQATFKMVLMCNKVPMIPNADRAIKNRTRLFPFTSTWVDNPPEDENEQKRLKLFKKNPSFERKIPMLAPAFLWIMVQYFPHYANEGLPDPQIVTDYTESYWRDNDVYSQFVSDNVQEVYNESGHKDGSARVTLSEIYSEFKIWFRDACPGTKVPERSVVRNELSSRWGHITGNAWHGIRLITGNSVDTMTSDLKGQPKIIGPIANINQPNIQPTQTKQPYIPPGTVKLITEPTTPPKKQYPLILVKPTTPPKTITPTKTLSPININNLSPNNSTNLVSSPPMIPSASNDITI